MKPVFARSPRKLVAGYGWAGVAWGTVSGHDSVRNQPMVSPLSRSRSEAPTGASTHATLASSQRRKCHHVGNTGSRSPMSATKAPKENH